MDLCRLCSNKTAPNFCKNLFSHLNDTINLPEIIAKLTEIIIREDDRLPKLVCLYCYEKLINFNDFRKSVLQVDNNFHQQLEQKIADCTDGGDDTDRDAVEQIEIEIVDEKPICGGLVCNQCGKSFTTKQSLYRHNYVHRNKNRYQCEFCGKHFYFQSKLNNHLTQHKKEKPYKCVECGKCFAYKDTLNLHQRRHTGEKPYICDVCGKRFLLNYHLSTHLLLHNGMKPFQCNLCDCAFKHRASLKLHQQRNHNGEKSFICNVCGKGFFMKSNLNRHLKIHNEQKPYICEFCSRGFTKLAYLQMHLIKLHNK